MIYNVAIVLLSYFADWNLVTIADEERIYDIAPLNQIKVLSYKEKGEWILEPKYNIGGRKS